MAICGNCGQVCPCNNCMELNLRALIERQEKRNNSTKLFIVVGLLIGSIATYILSNRSK